MKEGQYGKGLQKFNKCLTNIEYLPSSKHCSRPLSGGKKDKNSTLPCGAIILVGEER